VSTLATSPARVRCCNPACGRLSPLYQLRRGLCRPCYYGGWYRPGHTRRIPGVAEKYPLTGTLANLDGPIWTQDVKGAVPVPPPTSADPGSPEKRAAIFRRARKRQSLFHPSDPALPLRELAMSPRLAWLWRLLIGVDPTIGDVLKELAQIAAGPTYQRQRRPR
jgi:hypothetical protein